MTASNAATVLLAVSLVASVAPGALARTLQQLGQVPVNRTTIDGTACIIPFQLPNGNTTYYDCAPYNGGAICQVAGGQYDTCVPIAGAANDTIAKPFDGPTGNGTQQQGSSVATIRGQDGETCRLPLMYNGAAVDNCVQILGQAFCWGAENAIWTPCQADNTLYLPEPASNSQGMTAAASTFVMVPVLYRNTTDGETCLLPTVDQGEILDDCVLRAGVPSCITADGVWKPCDIEPSQEATWVPSGQGLDVANRVTLDGQACLLPAVMRGYLYFDCVDVWGSSGGQVLSVEACPVSNGSWAPCDSVDPANPSRPFSASYVLNRTRAGGLGQLCTVLPDVHHPEHGCQGNNTSCFPLPELGGNVSQALHGLGFCSVNPVGGTFGVYEMIEAKGLPTPLAHFPLTNYDLASVLLPYYAGSLYIKSGTSPELRQDAKFASVLNCNRTEFNAIRLDNVPYGVDGDFAINLWMRRWPDSNTSGMGVQYLYSHAGVQATSVMSPNSIQLLVPDSQHPAGGLVRAIVLDDTDNPNTLTGSGTYLDSDGQIDGNVNTTNVTTHRKHADVNDGKWHMITLSTMSDDSKGYVLYVDGQLVASLSVNTTDDLGVNVNVNVTGGDPALMTEDITLCARSDASRERFFDGSIAQLMLFNAALTPDQVSLLYQQYNGTQSNVSASAGADPSQLGDGATPLVQPSGSSDTAQFGSSNSSSPKEGVTSVQSTAPEASTQPVAQSSTPSSSDGSSSSSSSGGSGLSSGAIAGIVVGSVCAATLVGGAVFVMKRKPGKAVGRFESFSDEPDGFAAAVHAPNTHPGEVQLFQASHSPPGSPILTPSVGRE